MIAGLSGSLLSHDAMSGELENLCRGRTSPNTRWFHKWHEQTMRQSGPSSSARQVYDRVAAPLSAALGFHIVPTATSSGGSGSILATLQVAHRPVASVVVTTWGLDPAHVWREVVRHGVAHGLKWCVLLTGPVVRVLDASHTYDRRFAQFDLEITINDPPSLSLFCALLSGDAFIAVEPALDCAVALSERHRARVRSSLQQGVHDALTSLVHAFAAARRRRSHLDASNLFDESLVVIYRILFLLFAEARGLVPKWHPVYRDSYTVESLREPAERYARPSGLWESLQAIARLAHRGCRAGALRVPAFNGRLFSPVEAPLADSLALDDGAVRDAMVALTTRPGSSGRHRIAYADLGVEQLGGVYERVLDYAPEVGPGNRISLTPVGRRKATGTFYTPRALTEFMVRRALAPLVRDASPDQILALRIVDPAMGSGAFLVAACRYLAIAYESALIRVNGFSSSDVDEADRASFRRTIAQRCLFGVDINAMAVQLGRLSLWLATLARDKPLTFLDHHLRIGNSLAGASVEDVLRPPPSGRRRRRQLEQLPLFDLEMIDKDMQRTIASRLSLANEPGDTIEQVRAKERVWTSLQQSTGPLGAWKSVANLWCSDWFRNGSRQSSAAFGPLVDQLLGRRSVLPPHLSKPILDDVQAVADRERFFHWQLEFPEAFYDQDGKPSAHPGFDAVLGNPPWEMLRGKRDGSDDGALTAFSRGSGTYLWQGEGHANLYQLFLERALKLARPGGRIALVLPSGFAVDHGCARLRRAVLDGTSIDTFVTIENRDAVFPIHRGLKFLLVAATPGEPTSMVPCRSGVRSTAALDRIPDLGIDGTIGLPRTVIDKLSGDQAVIPDVRTTHDVTILSRTVFLFPALSSHDGWGVSFGRELNATDDRHHFISYPARGSIPVLEGKRIRPFAADVDRVHQHIARATAVRLLGPETFTRARLAYRDVAAASNRVTLIAAIVPANVVTTHTLFCMKNATDRDVQLFLCGVFNSFVANYLVRMRVGTHVNVSIIDQLRVPRPPIDSPAFRNIVALTSRVVATQSDVEAVIELQAAVAHLYRLDVSEFAHVLDTFPLVPIQERAAVMRGYRNRPPVEPS